MGDAHKMEEIALTLCERGEGASKAEIMAKCGEHWDEYAWKRMVRSQWRRRNPIFCYDKKNRVWKAQ